MAKDEWVSFDDVEVEHETENAILCVCADWKDKEWIPKSQISPDSDVFNKRTSGGTLIMKAWLAEKRGLV